MGVCFQFKLRKKKAKMNRDVAEPEPGKLHKHNTEDLFLCEDSPLQVEFHNKWLTHINRGELFLITKIIRKQVTVVRAQTWVQVVFRHLIGYVCLEAQYGSYCHNSLTGLQVLEDEEGNTERP